MDNKINYIDKAMLDLKELRTTIEKSKIEKQKEEILKDSPYTEEVNNYIANYQEFYSYYTLNLQEAKVTRTALIREIDKDLYISSENATNFELMSKGKAPYSYDAEEGIIELHHIGQDYNAPFAELTKSEHIMSGNNKIFHTETEESWRSDKNLLNSYLKERAEYWKKRASGEYSIKSKIDFQDINNKVFPLPEKLQSEIIETIDALYNECDIKSLDYLSDLAKSYSLVKKTGYNTLSEFVFSTRNENENLIICPYCKSPNYSLYGFQQNLNEKIQRYKCNVCNRTFTAISQSLVSKSYFSYVDWIKFIDCVYNGHTLDQIAKTCGISTKTAHNNKIKLFYALKLLDDKVKLKGNIVVDETFTHSNFKGNYNEETFVLPREPHKRGGEVHQKGLSKEQVCVVCALDDEGNCIAHVTGTGSPDITDIEMGLDGYISSDEVICIYTDQSNSLKKYMDRNSYPHKRIKSEFGKKRKKKLSKDEKNTEKHLQRINSLHSRLKKFINIWGGPSTKYLSGYLYLFAWKERNKDREPIESYKELLSVMTEPSSYMSVEDILKNNLLPNAYEMEAFKKVRSRFPERDNAIYDKFAAGMSMEQIGKEYGMTKQNVSKIITKKRNNGEAYKTKKEIEKEEATLIKNVYSPSSQRAKIRLTFSSRYTRMKTIYEFYQKWTLSKKEFYALMMQIHNITERQVKIDLRDYEYLLLLKDEIRIQDTYTYKGLDELYEEIFNEYQEMRKENINISQKKCCEFLGNKYQYTPNNILRIINIMSDEKSDYSLKTKKVSSIEKLNRDKAIFVEYANWTGTRKDFCRWVGEKYNISYDYAQKILTYVLNADISRYDMV